MGQTVVNVRLTEASRVTGFALAPVLVDAVLALGAIATGVAEALVDVVLAVDTCRSLGTDALVAVDEVLAGAPVLAGRRGTLVDLRLAQKSRVSCVAHASEGVVPVQTGSLSTGRG